MTKPLVIIGAGAHAREQYDLITATNAIEPTYDLLGFVVEPEFADATQQLRGLPVFSDLDAVTRLAPNVAAVCAVGDSARRYNLIQRARWTELTFERLLHPSAVIADTARFSAGVIVSAATVISCDVALGTHTHVNLGCTISHDGNVGNFVSLAPGVHVAGHVDIGDGCHIGVGASVRDRCTLGAWSVIGAGAVVVADVPDNSVVMGVPARVVNVRRKGWHLEHASAHA